MREIVTFHVGKCGSLLASEFWKEISEEHEVQLDGRICSNSTTNGLEYINIYYEESSQSKYIPRSVFVDLGSQSIDSIKAGQLRNLFHPDTFIIGNCSSGNNWARGHNVQGAECINSLMDIVRRNVETCDSLQGFQMTHSLGGGTGSGLGSLLIAKVREEYQSKIYQTFSIFPSPKVSDCVVEPYNTGLSMNALSNDVDSVITISNESLYDICVNNLGIKSPTFRSLNSIISTAMTGITSSFRFANENSINLRKMVVNLNPYLVTHYYVVAIAPLNCLNNKHFFYHSTDELINIMFSSGCTLAENFKFGKFFGYLSIFRGESISKLEVDYLLAQYKATYNSYYVKYTSHSYLTSVISKQSKLAKMTSTLVANNSTVANLIKRLNDAINLMLNRKAYLHWYTQEGIEELEFTECLETINTVIDSYNTNEWGTFDDTSVYDEEGEEEH